MFSKLSLSNHLNYFGCKEILSLIFLWLKAIHKLCNAILDDNYPISPLLKMQFSGLHNEIYQPPEWLDAYNYKNLIACVQLVDQVDL